MNYTEQVAITGILLEEVKIFTVIMAYALGVVGFFGNLLTIIALLRELN